MSVLLAEFDIGEGIPTFFYRCFREDGALLYVGISANFQARMNRHAREAEWWSQRTRTTAVLFGDRVSAACAETAAIISERPIFNDAQKRAEDADMSHVGMTIMQRRTDLGVSRQALAAAVGVGEVLIGAIERGDRAVTRKVRDAIARHLDMKLPGMDSELDEAIQRITEAYQRAAA